MRVRGLSGARALSRLLPSSGLAAVVALATFVAQLRGGPQEL